MLSVVTGNILDAKVDALVNTVNTAGVMGKGLALQFKKAFPGNFAAYAQACKEGRVQVGEMFVYQVGGIVQPRYVVNFPTKAHWRGKSKLEFIEAGLAALLREIRAREIRSVAIPPLGAGLGGLAWPDVLARIRSAFSGVDDVEVQVFQPPGAPAARDMQNRTTRPKMTPGRAAVISLMNRYLTPEYGAELTLLEVQKLAYFLQEAGQPLRLAYEKYHYGPYADNLRHVLNRLEGHFITGYGDGQNTPGTSLALTEGAAEEAESLLAASGETQSRLARIARLIEGFETPLGMELLGTVHWSAKTNPDAKLSPEKAAESVHEWSARKAGSMTTPQITAAWNRLHEQGWLSEGTAASV